MSNQVLGTFIFTFTSFLFIIYFAKYIRVSLQQEIARRQLLEVKAEQTASLQRQDEVVKIYEKKIAETPDDWESIDKLRAQNHQE